MDYTGVLEEIQQQVAPQFGKGKVADYIPALANVPPTKFGMALHTVTGERYAVGDASEPYSIQSVSKAFTLMMVLNVVGDDLWRRVGREPSGNPFNSLVQLEYEHGVPRNPFINAGAIVVADAIVTHFDDPMAAVVDFMRFLSGNPDVHYDEEVARSEAETGFINQALANFLKGHGNLENEVATVLDLYFHQCSLTMSCDDLSRAALHLAKDGYSPLVRESILTDRRTKRINSLMLTCGLYDAVGNFAFRVGLPAKSGVGGGIVAVLPGEYSVAVWSPELDPAGNSLVGTSALELLTTLTKRSIF